MTEPFVIAGDFWLRVQEGGFAWDGWALRQARGVNLAPQIVNAATNMHLGDHKLDDMVATYFGAERIKAKDIPRWRMGEPYPKRSYGAGDRHIGLVRITIEKLEDARPNTADPRTE